VPLLSNIFNLWIKAKYSDPDCTICDVHSVTATDVYADYQIIQKISQHK